MQLCSGSIRVYKLDEILFYNFLERVLEWCSFTAFLHSPKVLSSEVVKMPYLPVFLLVFRIKIPTKRAVIAQYVENLSSILVINRKPPGRSPGVCVDKEIG